MYFTFSSAQSFILENESLLKLVLWEFASFRKANQEKKRKKTHMIKIENAKMKVLRIVKSQILSTEFTLI